MVHKHCQNTTAGRSGYKAMIATPAWDAIIEKARPKSADELEADGWINVEAFAIKTGLVRRTAYDHLEEQVRSGVLERQRFVIRSAYKPKPCFFYRPLPKVSDW
jgi:hypothetical protein